MFASITIYPVLKLPPSSIASTSGDRGTVPQISGKTPEAHVQNRRSGCTPVTPTRAFELVLPGHLQDQKVLILQMGDSTTEMTAMI